MRIRDYFRRIAGVHISDNGDVAAVWLAVDPETQKIHVYDCAMLKREVMPVIAEALNARGRFIPVVCNNKGFADKLMDRGCNMLPETADDKPGYAEVVTRDILGQMRMDSFKVKKELRVWVDEFNNYRRNAKDQVTTDAPLMAATRHAMDKIEFARSSRAQERHRRDKYKKVAIR